MLSRPETVEHSVRGTAVVALAVAVVAIGAVTTAHGIGITPDGVAYLGLAEELGSGHLHITPSWSSSTHYPPGWSYLVGVVGLAPGFTISEAARVVNLAAAAVFALTFPRAVRGSRQVDAWLPVLAASYICTSLLWTELMTHALTELVFCALVVLCLQSLERTDTGRLSRPLVGAVLLAAAATSVRYVGVALVVPVVVVLSWQRMGPLPARGLRAGVAGTCVVAPIALWLASSPESPVPISHMPSGETAGLEQLLASLETLGHLLPHAVLLPSSRHADIVAGVVALLAPLVAVWARRPPRPTEHPGQRTGQMPWYVPWLAFGYSYVVVVGLQRWRGDSEILDRYWLPYVVVAAVVVFRPLSGEPPSRSLVTRIAVPALAFATIANLVHVQPYATDGRRDGLSINSVAFQTSELFDAVAAAGPVVVLTDAPAAVSHYLPSMPTYEIVVDRGHDRRCERTDTTRVVNRAEPWAIVLVARCRSPEKVDTILASLTDVTVTQFDIGVVVIPQPRSN